MKGKKAAIEAYHALEGSHDERMEVLAETYSPDELAEISEAVQGNIAPVEPSEQAASKKIVHKTNRVTGMAGEADKVTIHNKQLGTKNKISGKAANRLIRQDPDTYEILKDEKK